MIRVYNETVDFKNWNYFTDGEFVDFVDYNHSNINFQIENMHKEPYWITGLAHFGSQNESRVFTINYPILGKYEPSNNRTNILNKIKNNYKINERSRIENRAVFSSQNNSNYIEKVDSKKKDYIEKVDFHSKSNIITKIKNLIFYYEREIMSKFITYGNYSFAKSIEEARNKSKRTLESGFNDTENDSIIITDVGSSFFTESLYVILKEKKNDKFSHYIITDYLYNVLIDNEMGAIYPKAFNNLNQSIFPNISDINNSIWNSVEKEIINVPIDVPLLVNASASIQYMVIKRIINTRSRYSFYLIMLFEINPKITEIYSMVTNVFTICLVLLCIVLISMKFSLNFEDNKYKVRLNHMQKKMIDDDNKTKYLYMGKITESINKLRNIQLMNINDTYLNNSIDLVIKEFTLNNENLFNIELDIDSYVSSSHCSFCSNLIDNEHDLSVLKRKNDELIKQREKENFKSKKILSYYLKDANPKQNENKKNSIYLDVKRNDEILFYIWKNKMNLLLNLQSNENLLNINPHIYLVRKFMTFILKRDLLMVEIYPDSLLLFILKFTKENIVSYHCKIKSFQLLKKLIKYNFEFWIESKLDLFILFFASILRNSRIKKANEIINLFDSYFRFRNDYFIHLLKVLIDDTNTNCVMEIYGSLLNRTQSPDFSVISNIYDMVLFMKALLSFIDFAPYLIDFNENEKCFNEINEIIFTKNEKEIHEFLYNFHYEMSINVVLPWLNLMNSISPMKNIKNKLVENINFWKEGLH